MDHLNGAPLSLTDLKALALTNFGHFTSLRVDEGRAKGLSLHLDRLVHDCRTVFDAELDRDRIRSAIRQAASGQTGSCVVRVTVFDPQLGVARPGADARPHLLATCRPVPRSCPPLRVATRAYQRDLPEVKHVGLFGQLAVRRAAQRAGFDDALFTEPGTGAFSEGGTWNVGFIDDHDRVIWPQARVLPGVTMRLLQDVYPSLTRPFTPADLPTLRAAFATNTAIGVRPLSAIDDLPLDPEHPVLAELRRRYEGIPSDAV
ncbi:aminotransferase class IV family protein [Streptomyces natalensis]|uniref:Aminotransferase n=1 Tax=Streptomyces natalensis ATCC 27448 TaxID=1240678 RepID=A0A0D7CJ08_9ACTN|nr:aminotransferase class IV family protein [Streptomyces natalensis]KIZ16209.1 aminotransferase [Streptomyces natalensis ATCC 27448]